MITLATLHVYSAQQVFDYISRHLLTQGEPCKDVVAYTDAPACLYKNGDNQRCAAGCLFGPEEYKRQYEGKSWQVLVSENKVPRIHCELIMRLQKVHDTWKADNWYEGLLDVARVYNFDTTNLDMYAKENNYC